MPKIVIIGNSAAGFSAAQELLKDPYPKEITIISEENYPAYNKSLFLDYLSGAIKEKDIFLVTEDFYAKNNIEFKPGFEVTRIDFKRKNVVLEDKSRVSYDYLIIASGRKVNFPDITCKNKEGAVGFNTLEDLKKIKDKLLISNTVCLIGHPQDCRGLAELIAHMGKEVKILCEEANAVLTTQNEKIELLSAVKPIEFIGESVELQAVKLSNGKVLAATLAVFVDHLVPAVDFLKDSEIKLSEGFIAIDENFSTNIEHVFSCGSVCKNEANPLPDKNWQDCINEGINCANNLTKNFTNGESACHKY